MKFNVHDTLNQQVSFWYLSMRMNIKKKSFSLYLRGIKHTLTYKNGLHNTTTVQY